MQPSQSHSTLTPSSHLLSPAIKPPLDAYSPRRRLPTYLRHSSRHRLLTTMNGEGNQMNVDPAAKEEALKQQQAAQIKLNESLQVHTKPTHSMLSTPHHQLEIPRSHRKPNGTRDLMEQQSNMSSILQTPATSSKTKSRLLSNHTPIIPTATPTVSNSFLSPFVQTSSTTPVDSSSATSSTNSSLTLSFTSTPTSDHSDSLNSSAEHTTSTSFEGFTSPIQPQQLSFDSSMNTSTEESPPSHNKTNSSPHLPPFSFAAPTAVDTNSTAGHIRRSSFPILQTSNSTGALLSQPTSHGMFPPLAPMSNNFIHRPSAPFPPANHSNSVSPPTLSNVTAPKPILCPATNITKQRTSSDSPVLNSMELGSTPPPTLALSASSNPFVSPIPIRSVTLNGHLKTGPLLPRNILPRPNSPSPLAVASSSKPMKSTLVAKPPMSHQRSASNGLTSSSSATSSSTSNHRRRNSSLLNSKRSRGLSMDQEAELESGATFVECDPATGAASSSTSMCPAEAITHSMRKLKVKKSAHVDEDSPFTQRTIALALRSRHKSGFSSSEDEDDTGMSLHAKPTPLPGSLNMKQLRREKQQQSVQKKRELAELEAAGGINKMEMDLLGAEDDDNSSKQAGLVAALNEAAAQSAAAAATIAGHSLLPPSTPMGFKIRSPMRKKLPTSSLEIAIPFNPATQHVAVPIEQALFRTSNNLNDSFASVASEDADDVMGLSVTHAVNGGESHELVGSRLTWSSDEEDEDQINRRRMPISFSLPVNTASSTSAAVSSTPFKPLPPLDNEDISSPNDHVVTTLDFGPSASAGIDEDEQRDQMGVMRGSSNFSLDSNGASQFSPNNGVFNNSYNSNQSTPQLSARQLYSPPPQHTPLTPASTSSSAFGFHVPVATPLPVLPCMQQPKPTTDITNRSICVTNTMGVATVPSELDFMSPVAHNQAGFNFPGMSPNSSSFQLNGEPMSATTPLPEAGNGTFSIQLTRSLSEDRPNYKTNTNSFDMETPPTSPPTTNTGLLMPPSGGNLFTALSPDPKAFADPSSLIRRTPARGKLQPPPTPVRPSSIKRTTNVTHHVPVTPGRPIKPHGLSSSSKMLQLNVPDTPTEDDDMPPISSNLFPSSSSSSSSILPPPAPSHHFPLTRISRLERTNSLYDSKILVDFKAHLEAVAEKKRKILESVVHEDGDAGLDTSMESVDHEPSPILAPVATPSPPLNISIWETCFVDKVLVGTGSFFQTYRCQSCDRVNHPDEFGEFYAVKRSIKEFRGKKDRGLYLREIAVMESIGQHENIVKHIRAWQEDLHFFIQMEFCPMNLTEYIFSLQQAAVTATSSTGGALSPTSNPYILSDALLKNITLQLASALHHIHDRNLIHLDVKPDNVLVNYTGILRLADFGQARILHPENGGASGDWDMDGVEGDSVYMSPELLSNSSMISPAADIFSLGLLLVELASGVMLPKSGDIWHDLREGRAHQHVHGRVSAQMEHIILNLLEPKPARRPTAKQIIQWLETHHEEQTRQHT